LCDGKFKSFLQQLVELEQKHANDNYLQDYYEFVLKSFAKIKNNGHELVEQQIKEAVNNPSYFNVKKAGTKSNAVYQKFKSAFSAHEKSKSALYYVVAMLFRKQFIKNEKNRLISAYNKAEKYYENGQYERALTQIKKFDQEDKTLYPYHMVRGRLEKAYNTLEGKIWKAKHMRKKEKLPIVNKQIQFGIGYSPINATGHVKDPVWYSENRRYSAFYKKLVNRYGTDYVSYTRYNLSSKYAVEFNFFKGNIKYSSPGPDYIDQISSETDKWPFYSISAHFLYYLRT
jgi:hypothetical protein